MDIELDYAHRLGDVLRDMRRELTDEAARRVLLWAMDRWGISGAIIRMDRVPDVCRTQPAPEPKANGIRQPAALPIEPEDEPNGNTDLTCHICGKVCEDRRGLQGHLRIKHKIRLADVVARA